jgi:gliding motility associated protien GldN
MVLAPFFVNAQGYAEFEFGNYSVEQDPFAKNSVRPIVESDRMFVRSLWQRVDLREKQNEPLRASKNEITRLILEAAKIGAIRPYTNDSLSTRMNPQDFLDKLKVPGSGVAGDEGFGEEEDDWGDEAESEGSSSSGGGISSAYWKYDRELYILDIKENLIFDRKRSRMYYDIESITIIVPSEFNPKGVETSIGTFSYKDLVKNLFSKNPDAQWYNPQNITEHRNLQEAFDLRLFVSHLTKYSNPKDESIDLIYPNGQTQLEKALEYMHNLAEYESNTWSN